MGVRQYVPMASKRLGTTVRIPDDVRAGVAAVAAAERRSLSGMVIYILSRWLETHQNKERVGG